EGVHLENLPEEGRVGAVEVARGDDGGVVDDGVEAPEPLHREGDEALGAAFRDEILDVEDGAVGTDLGDDLLAQLGLEPVDDDAGALDGALDGDGPADAGAASGDDDDFMGEAHGRRRVQAWVKGP